MTILDRTRGGSRRIRIDASQLADDLARRLPDLDTTRDQATSIAQDAADSARHHVDHAAAVARGIRDDIAASASKVQADSAVDEIGQRIRAVASTGAIRALVMRLEKDLPGVDPDRYERAYSRGRAQARAKYLAVGLVAGVGVGALAATLLDPERGKLRREAIASRTSDLAKNLGAQVGSRARLATDKARGAAIGHGITEAPEEPVAAAPFADGPVTDPASTQWEAPPAPDGGAVQPLAAAEADFANAAGTAGAVVTDAVDLAGDRAATRSIHG